MHAGGRGWAFHYDYGDYEIIYVGMKELPQDERWH